MVLARLVVVLFCCLWGVHGNHYMTLGVSRDASADVVKAAYRKLALKHHPDRMPRSASAETRASSRRVFEQANEAFECLSDPTQRRQYDFELANPIQKGEDGVFRRGEPGSAPPRPRVEVRVECTLEQLGGWEAAEVTAAAWSSALGATVTRQVAERIGLPLKIYPPAGSRNGDIVRTMMPQLGPAGVDIEFVLVALPHRRWSRRGDALVTTLTLPAWHNLLRRQVRVKGIDGERVVLRRRGERVRVPPRAELDGRPRPRSAFDQPGDSVRVSGAGMPVKSTGDRPTACERGELQAKLLVRSVGAEVLLTLVRACGGVCALVTGKSLVRRVPYAAIQLFETAIGVASYAQEFTATELLGRWRPEMRRARARARSERALASQRRRAEREAKAKAQQRRKRRQALWDFSAPARQRVRAAWNWAWE